MKSLGTSEIQDNVKVYNIHRYTLYICGNIIYYLSINYLNYLVNV